MACVRTEADNNFMKELVGRKMSFFGYTDSAVEGSWEWITQGCSSTLSKFQPGEPNDMGGEDCGSMPIWHSTEGAQWNDEACSCKRGCICEHGLQLLPKFRTETWESTSTCGWTGEVPVAATGEWEGCSDSWCTSAGGDCWAGSSDEPCTCRRGKARTSGEETWFMGRKYYKYSCCESGWNGGEQCGDYGHEYDDGDGASAIWLIIILILIIGGGLGGLLIGVVCCYAQGSCCFTGRNQPPQPVSYGQPTVTYGQPVVAQAVAVKPVQAQAVVVAQPAPVTNANPTNEENPNLQGSA